MDLKPPAPSQAADDAKPADADVPAVTSDQAASAPQTDAPAPAAAPDGVSVEDAMKQVSDLFNNAPPEEVDKMVAAETPVAPTTADPLPAADALPAADIVGAAGLDTAPPAVDTPASDSSAPVFGAEPADPAMLTPDAPKTPFVVPAASDTAPAASDAAPAPAFSAPAPSVPDASSGLAPADVTVPVIGGVATTGAQKRRPKWFMKAVIAVGAVLVLGGGSAAAYFGYYVPNKPENILKMALFNTMSSDITSGYIDGDFEISAKSEDFSLGGTITGKADQDSFDINIEMDAVLAKIKIDLRSVDGKSYFVRLGGLSGLPELLEASGVDPSISNVITTLDDQWFEINESLVKELTGGAGTALSEADLKKLVDIYKQHAFLKVKEVLPAETIKGLASYHYKVVVDKTALQAAYQQVKDAKLKSFPISSEEMEQLNGVLKDADFNKYPFDIWIDKKTKVIDQVGITFEDGEAKFEGTMTFFDYNKPVEVEKPEDAKSILEALSQVYGAFSDTYSGGATTEEMFLDQLQGGNGISL